MWHVICGIPVSAEISLCSLWSRSMMLWSLHTENTRLISRGIIFNVLRPVWSRYFNVTDTFCQFCGIYGISDLEGHLRSLIFAPIKSACITSCCSSIVTLVLSCSVLEILQLLYEENRFLDSPPIPVKMSGCSPWSRSVMLGSAKSDSIWKLFLKLFGRIPTYVITIHQRHGTDGQTTCRSNTALCVASRGKKCYENFSDCDFVI